VTDYLLAGRYRLTDRIAAGGMGEVWRGEDVLLNRAVAVKLLPTGRAGDESFLARFRAEARYAASLSHPGIARVYDYGESAEFGGAYLILELVNGEPLSAILARAGRLSPDPTLDIIGQAARALDAAHQAGIVHRDIKPGNLLVAAGTTKITDFGIATAVRAAQAAHLTETGMVMGTAMYVSPEQATGAPVDASSDIYSLGVVAYECLAGHVPFMASDPLAIAYAHKHAPVPALPPDVPAPVAGLVYDMLAKTPAGRPASARAVADRADMLREALFLDRGAMGGAVQAANFAGMSFAGATRADLPAAPTGALRGDGQDPDLFGPRPPGNRRRWLTAGLTAVLCALAAATGLYLSGHLHGQTSGDVGNNSVQGVSSSALLPSQSASQPVTTSPTPSTVEKPSTAPGATSTSKPTKTSKPTSSPKISPSSTNHSSSASSSTSASTSSSSSASASSSSSSSTTPSP
jgi:serine/threonine protein kinase